jgi:hypothetical protein
LLEQELLNLYDQEADKQAVSLFLNWFRLDVSSPTRQLALYGKISSEDYGQLDYIYRSKEEVQTMLTATLEQERKKIYQAGKQEGRAETQRQTIGQLLRFRFELAEVEQAQYIQQVARIQELPHLDELVNVLLNKATTLENFTKLVTKYLSAGKAESGQ